MYVIARTRKGRPTLQHRVSDTDRVRTLCGLFIEGWSRAYQKDPIPQILCTNCGRKEGRL